MVKDLTGMKFGRLEVISRADDKIYKSGEKKTQWNCKCDCGKSKVVLAKLLTNGHTQSCGCLKIELFSKRRKATPLKHNPCLKIGDIVVMYLDNGNEFYIDADDYEVVNQYCWHQDKDGYIVSSGNSQVKPQRLHRLVTRCPEDMVVDHIGGTLTIVDNRKKNLRIVTVSQNQMNRKLQQGSQSGCNGVRWDKDTQKWRATITVDKKAINLGLYLSLDAAIVARKNAEELYFGEWSYDNSQRIYQNPQL